MSASAYVDTGSTGVESRSTPVNAEHGITVIAAVLTVVLTAVAFWLSYEHLQEVAAEHGMADAVARSWAWPATVDLFIVIGELLILRASLAHKVDWWAIGLVTAGDGASIALNVAGVGKDANALDYVVAAVPPVAALLAFGALMRQVHAYLARKALTGVTTPPPGVNEPSTPVNVSVDRPPAAPAAPSLSEPEAAGELPVLPVGVEGASAPVDAEPVAVEARSTAVDLCMPVIYPNRVDQVVRALYGTDFTQPNTARMTMAMAGLGLGASESTARTARGRVKAREPYLADFPTAIAG
ncbi:MULTISPECIES: DUF2637 domain-containing protein [Streptomyces]|uniref:DUF2637 domain-containing protein n=1 Tax=Streptomyces koelreuteriae TaxID=2838015 RepID=A0ABX8FUN9_9ACTN|nr:MULTISPECIES: DUF2637 domain-containing protein [Streptomyces]QWB24798.1 DUF2637 domain-containing protein [Streptomyces koelreuteriae]UUA07815.1 DUF2637 domain-containing protein [Streptomyces koelreuteriae]UUA15444.1 DUF2637 domain-containing protein [Streptomyces sp. CRCS-T-1]